MGGMAALAWYLLLVVVVVGLVHGATHLLGERHRQRGAELPYESGVAPTGDARIRFPADFYLVAMFFVIFDAASIFLLAWAVAAREAGWAGFAALVLFLVETVAALAYLWRSGVFDWGKVRGAEHLARHGLGPESPGRDL